MYLLSSHKTTYFNILQIIIYWIDNIIPRPSAGGPGDFSCGGIVDNVPQVNDEAALIKMINLLYYFLLFWINTYCSFMASSPSAQYKGARSVLPAVIRWTAPSFPNFAPLRFRAGRAKATYSFLFLFAFYNWYF